MRFPCGFGVAAVLAAVLSLPGAAGCQAPHSQELADERLQDPWFRAGREAVLRARQLTGEGGDRARNVILFVGDGMSVPTVTAARILEGQRRGESGEENLLAFERLPHIALSKTYNTDRQVPDSAGTMTAMVSGVKTRYGVLGVDASVARGDHTGVAAGRVPTLLEEAEERGLATGVVTTTNLTHATPAACYAHTPERNWESDAALSQAARAAGFPDIARQLVEFDRGDGIEVMLGGGRAHFLPATAPDPEHPSLMGARRDGRDLTAEWRQRYPDGAYVWNREQFAAADAEAAKQILGLFEPSHMRFEADRASDPGGEPSLSEMTTRAIEILSRNPRGFFLMVEGGRIDHGHHFNNAYRALTDTIELSNAVRAALDKTDPRETLIVVTADHGHTLSISGYPRRGNDILGLTESPVEGPGLDALGLPYTTLSYANGPGYTGASSSEPEGSRRLPVGLPLLSRWPLGVQGITQGRPDLSRVDTADPLYMQEATVPLFRETHTGEDVAIYAGGPGAALFHGVQEQSYIYHAMVEALGWVSAP